MAEEEALEEDVNPEGDLEEGEEGEEGEGGKPKKLLTPKRLIIVGIALFALIAVPVSLYLLGIIGSPPPELAEDGSEIPVEEIDAETALDPAFYNLEEFLVNLNTGGKQVKFLKMQVILELPSQETVLEIEKKLPRIRDSFQVYLRELRSEDLQGSGGLYRLREELLLRINKEVYPTKVNNILFKDILIQ